MTSPRFKPESAALLAGSTLVTTTPAALAGNPNCRALRAVAFSTVMPCRASSLLFSGCSFRAVSAGISARVSGRVFSAPPRNTFTFTLVPGAISETCMRSSALLFTGVPLMSRMMSPFSNPAFWAGLLGVTSPISAPRTSGSWKALAMEGVKKIVGVAERHGLTTAGVFSSGESFEGVFNSRGLSNWHGQTSAEVSITMLGGDSSGWQKANSPDVANLDPPALAAIAAQKALDSARPREIPAGKYTVILEPAAVLDIVGVMFWDYSGMAILDQRSFLTGRIGTKLFGDNISIWDDMAHPLQTGSPFDGEGVQRQRVELIENGIVNRVVYARATAERMKRSQHKDKVGPIAATGHGFALPNEMGEMPLNIVFAAVHNPQTVEQMIASTERGVLVTRLWYIREVEPFENQSRTFAL